jgi:hypothetical protein
LDFSSSVVSGERSDQGHHRMITYGRMPRIAAALRTTHLDICWMCLDRENVLSLAFVSLQLEANLAHSLAAFARFDLVLLLALGSSFGARFLVHLLLATKPLLLEALHNVDGTTLFQRGFTSRVGFVLKIVSFQAVHAADLEATGTR